MRRPCRPRVATALLAAFIAAHAASQAADPAPPIDSPACRDALAALRAAEDERRTSGEPPDRQRTLQGLAPLRQAAARECLGGRADLAPQRRAQPPVDVPRPAMPPATAPVPPAPPAAVPRPAPPPVVITTCDAGGCWASDGSRLQRFGTHLMGPRGVCTVQGVVLSCP